MPTQKTELELITRSHLWPDAEAVQVVLTTTFVADDGTTAASATTEQRISSPAILAAIRSLEAAIMSELGAGVTKRPHPRRAEQDRPLPLLPSQGGPPAPTPAPPQPPRP